MGFLTGNGKRCRVLGVLLACGLVLPAQAETAEADADAPEPAAMAEPAAEVAVAAPATPEIATVPVTSSPDGEAALTQSLASRNWQLVLASVYTPEAAEQESARLLSKGLEVVTEMAEAKGKQVYRLTFGAFETREEAQHALDDQRRRPGFERAWVFLRQ